ncbi:MAG: acetylglutamate kinase [Phycisphaerales bacterium]
MTGVNKPLVVKIGGAIIDKTAALAKLCSVLAELHTALSQPGTTRGVVIVHGGGLAIDAHLRTLGYEARRVDGIRVTPPDQIDAVVEILAGRMNRSLVGKVNAALEAALGGSRAVGLCIGDGGLTTARPVACNDINFGCVGEITGGDPELVYSLLRARFLPVISPIACNDEGGVCGALNVNADDAASAVAEIIGAQALVMLSDVPGVLDADGELLAELDHIRIEQLITSGVISGGMIPKVRAALDNATRTGVATRIASWKSPESLLALASGASCGTLVLPAPTPDSIAPLTGLEMTS